MKIGMILDSEFPPDPRVENEARCLINDGHEVHLLCLDYGKGRSREEVIDGINLTRVEVSSWMYSLSALAYTIPLYHFLLKGIIKRFLLQKNIKLVHIHDIQVARSVFWLKNDLKLTIVLDLHENRPEIMKYYGHVGSFLGKLLIYPRIWKAFEYRYIRKADYVVTVTDEASDFYQKNIPEQRKKFYTVINSVNKTFYTNYDLNQSILSRYKDCFTLLYIGDTGLRRGLLTVFESLKFLKSEIRNIKVVVVGTSKEDYELKNYVQENDLDIYVDFVGWQDPSMFQSYILAASIGICPIHRNIHHDTTFANKLFQYMSLRRPVVVSNCTSQENLVKKYECGLVFQDRDASDFAEKVLVLANDDVLRDKLAANAESLINDKMNWDYACSPLLEIYNHERH